MTSPTDVAIQALDQRINTLDANLTTALGIANQSMENFQKTDNDLRARLETIVSEVNGRMTRIQTQMDTFTGLDETRMGILRQFSEQVTQQMIVDSTTTANLQARMDQMQSAMDQMALTIVNQQDAIDKARIYSGSGPYKLVTEYKCWDNLAKLTNDRSSFRDWKKHFRAVSNKSPKQRDGNTSWIILKHPADGNRR